MFRLLSSHHFFCKWYDSTNTSSARSSGNFGSQADLEISFFREMSMDTVFARYHLSQRL